MSGAPFIYLLLTFAVISAFPMRSVHGLTISDVSFQQANWFRPDGTLAQADSLWGRMTFSYNPENTDHFLNLTLANSLAGPEVWAVQNLPLFAVDDGSFSTRREGVDINLRELGMSAGQDWPGVFFKFSADTSIRGAPLTAPSSFINVEPVNYRFGVDVEAPNPGPFTDPGEPEGVKVDREPTKIGKRRDLRAVQEACAKCSTGSFARSLDWLNREFNLGVARTAQQIYEDLIARKIGEPNADGTPARDEWVARKDAYAREKTRNKIVTKVWDPGGQVDSIKGVKEESTDFSVWLTKEIRMDEDVELAYFYPGNAHIVTISELFKKDDELFAKYRDDEEQGNDEAGDGARETDPEFKTAKIYKDANGDYHFGADENTIYFAVSESVPEPPFTLALFGIGVLGLLGYRLGYRWNARSLPTELSA